MSRRVPVIIETHQTFLIWVDAEEGETSADVVKQLQYSGEEHEYIRRIQPIDADLETRVPKTYEYDQERLGPRTDRGELLSEAELTRLGWRG